MAQGHDLQSLCKRVSGLVSLKEDNPFKKSLIEIAKTSASPNAAYNEAIRALEALSHERAQKLAEATRFLAIILRDFGMEKFESVV